VGLPTEALADADLEQSVRRCNPPLKKIVGLARGTTDQAFDLLRAVLDHGAPDPERWEYLISPPIAALLVTYPEGARKCVEEEQAISVSELHDLVLWHMQD
jgi:hypothetical protein